MCVNALQANYKASFINLVKIACTTRKSSKTEFYQSRSHLEDSYEFPLSSLAHWCSNFKIKATKIERFTAS